MSDAAETLAGRLVALTAARPGERVIAALAGAPGSGKSTLAEAVAARLNAAAPGTCAVVPMDGFHLDDAILNARGWRARKGAPHTFDVGGLAALLARLKANEEPEIAIPLFDRALELSRAAARFVPRTTPVALVEGNYLLLKAEPWSGLARFFDLTARIDCAEAVLAERLAARWAALPAAEARAKIEENDLPNARLVASGSAAADLTIGGG